LEDDGGGGGGDGGAVSLSDVERGWIGSVSVGWRPRTTVGFAGPGKSIAGGKRCYISGVATDGRSMLRLLYYYNIRTGSCGGQSVGGGEQSRVGTVTRAVGVLQRK